MRFCVRSRSFCQLLLCVSSAVISNGCGKYGFGVVFLSNVVSRMPNKTSSFSIISFKVRFSSWVVWSPSSFFKLFIGWVDLFKVAVCPCFDWSA